MYTYALASLNHPKATQAKVTRYNSLDITKRRASYEVNLKVIWSVELSLYVEVEKKSITVWKPELSPRVSGFFLCTLWSAKCICFSQRWYPNLLF